MALPLYAITLFVSAFILFLIQPMIGKMILPKLGGTPQVWNTCMVFFQMVLLAGYAYTHTISTRLKLRTQLIVHGILLFVPFALLLPTPFNIRGWVPELGANPIPSTLGILLMYVGLPFLVVSTTAPLLQKWFVSTGHPAAKDPYFLYGASNLGSMLALLAYPFLIEPFTTINNTAVFAPTELGNRLSQPWIWTISYFVLLILVLACAALVWAPSGIRMPGLGTAAQHEPELASAGAAATGITTAGRKGRAAPATGSHLPEEPALGIQRQATDELTWGRRLRWVLLAAVPSSLMLGVTSFITTDLTPMPMFWLIPLTLYLASFIFVFARWPVVWTEMPHTIMLWAQPIAIGLMLLFGYMFGVNHVKYLWYSINFYVLGFFLTTMVCHGELAKDRPSTRYLTEFYLWMSVGGMLGGMFNGLIAPVVFFWGIVEFAVAVFAACLLRPKMGEVAWLDGFISSTLEGTPEPAPAHRGKGQPRHPAPVTRTATQNSLSSTLDFILPLIVFGLAFGMFTLFGSRIRNSQIKESEREFAVFLVYGVPLIVACFFLSRPVRFALAVTAVMLVHWFASERGGIAYQTRSYFGHIIVLQDERPSVFDGVKNDYVTRSLTHGTTHHGMNYQLPSSRKDWGDRHKDLSRLATTYYNRYGPAGRVMEMKHFNYFPGGPQNVYSADARMPCSQIGQLMAAVGGGCGALPYGNLVDLWSEPPFATVGLGTGTMASYGRPFQHVHFYEIDNQIRKLSLPEDGEPYFNYLRQAQKRGCEVEVLMGDARLRMDLPYRNFNTDKAYGPDAASVPTVEPPGGPENFYQMMVVDAFSSDAIPAHLLTLEALEMYFKHLREDTTPDQSSPMSNGILCVHTSNRYVDLPKVVATIAQRKGWHFLRGHDTNPGEKDYNRSSSEWIMVCKDRRPLEVLADLVPENYASSDPYWTWDVPTSDRFLWTDDYTNLWAVMHKRR